VLVVGTGDHDGIGRRLLGSVSDYLTRHANVPLVLVPFGRR
jgi:nucleotide-binding universal stress UspA family protein